MLENAISKIRFEMFLHRMKPYGCIHRRHSSLWKAVVAVFSTFPQKRNINAQFVTTPLQHALRLCTHTWHMYNIYTEFSFEKKLTVQFVFIVNSLKSNNFFQKSSHLLHGAINKIPRVIRSAYSSILDSPPSFTYYFKVKICVSRYIFLFTLSFFYSHNSRIVHPFRFR